MIYYYYLLFIIYLNKIKTLEFRTLDFGKKNLISKSFFKNFF